MKSRAFLARKAEYLAELAQAKKLLEPPPRVRRRVLGRGLLDLVVTTAPRAMICESLADGVACANLATRSGSRGKALCPFCWELQS